MKESYKPENIRSAEEIMRELGFSDLSSNAMQIAVRLGARRILKFHGSGENVLQVSRKSEINDPVTAADLQSGKIIKRLISKQYPNDSVNEEESGLHTGGERIWYVDPLDGTTSFGREQKYSSDGIAVYENGQPRAAAICQPFERELLVAESGKGAYVFKLDEKLAASGEPKRVHVSDKESLEDAIVYFDAFFNKNTTPRKLELIGKLAALAGKRFGVRMTGSNIDQQRQVACGRAEATITDAVGGFWDLAAGSLVVREAGGEFCGIDGKPVTEKTQIAIGGNKKIVELILPIAAECYKDYGGHK
jgi:myo-inositol-1(or 4)-monophosphatase